MARYKKAIAICLCIILILAGAFGVYKGFTFSMKNSTNFTGTINSDKQAGTVAVTLDSSSTWTLTGNAYVTSFDGNADNIITNGYHIYVNGSILK